MKEKRSIRGRLSFGSFMDIVCIIAMVNGIFPVVASFLTVGSPTRGIQLDLVQIVLIYLAGVISILVLGAFSFPAYCLASRWKRLPAVTVVRRIPETTE